MQAQAGTCLCRGHKNAVSAREAHGGTGSAADKTAHSRQRRHRTVAGLQIAEGVQERGKRGVGSWLLCAQPCCSSPAAVPALLQLTHLRRVYEVAAVLQGIVQQLEGSLLVALLRAQTQVEKDGSHRAGGMAAAGATCLERKATARSQAALGLPRTATLSACPASQ